MPRELTRSVVAAFAVRLPCRALECERPRVFWRRRRPLGDGRGFRRSGAVRPVERLLASLGGCWLLGGRGRDPLEAPSARLARRAPRASLRAAVGASRGDAPSRLRAG